MRRTQIIGALENSGSIAIFLSNPSVINVFGKIAEMISN
jgi:hypothetical protein